MNLLMRQNKFLCEHLYVLDIVKKFQKFHIVFIMRGARIRYLKVSQFSGNQTYLSQNLYRALNFQSTDKIEMVTNFPILFL